MSEDTYSRFLPTLLCDELVQLHIVNALVRDPSCLELFRRFLGSSPGSAELVARYEPRFQLWSLGVAAPAAGGISEAERAKRLSAAIEWALEQPPAQLGLAPGTPLLLNAKTALMAHRQAVLASGESTGVFGPFVASSAAAAAPAVSPPLPHTLRGGSPTPPPPPRQTGIFAEQSGRFSGDGDGGAAVLVCRRTDGGSIYDAAEEDAEMEKAALVARAQGVAEAEMGVATATLIKASPDQKLGIVLVCGGDINAPLHISKLRPGGLGALCGELQLGDRIVQINGCEARQAPPPAPPLSPRAPPLIAPPSPLGALPAPRPAVRGPLTRGP